MIKKRIIVYCFYRINRPTNIKNYAHLILCLSKQRKILQIFSPIKFGNKRKGCIFASLLGVKANKKISGV